MLRSIFVVFFVLMMQSSASFGKTPYEALTGADRVWVPPYLAFEELSLFIGEKVRLIEKDGTMIECRVEYRTNPVLITCRQPIEQGLLVVNQNGYVAAVTTGYKRKFHDLVEAQARDLREFDAVDPLDVNAACFQHYLDGFNL